MSIDSNWILWDERNSFVRRQLVHPGRQNTLYISLMEDLRCRPLRAAGLQKGSCPVNLTNEGSLEK